MAFGPDNNLYFGSSGASSIQVYDPITQSSLGSFGPGGITAMAFEPVVVPLPNTLILLLSGFLPLLGIVKNRITSSLSGRKKHAA